MHYNSTTNIFYVNKSGNLFSALLFLIIALLTFNSFSFTKTKGITAAASKWVGTWSTAPQLVETGNNPPSPGLSNNTLRQIVHASIGGDTLQMRFSNEFSTSSVTLNSVHIAVSKGSGVIDTTSDKILYFNGKPDITMAPGSAVTSDPFQFALQPLSDVAITIYFGNSSPDVTGHPGSRTTSYLLSGNQVTKDNFSGAATTDHWYVINTIDVLAPESAYAVAILGNSITDGRGSGTNKQDRWPDELARRLQANNDTKQVAVLNEGIGGNCVLGSCLGPSALSRFNRDVLNQHGIKWFVILEGVNDIGYAFNATQTAQNLINAYSTMIDSAHARGILVYGATILPFKGNSYYTVDHEKARSTVNDWIRNSGRFDGIIDLDKAVRDPNNPLQFLPAYDTGDHLHPNEAGHHAMAEAVDLNLFVIVDTTYQGIIINRDDIEKYFTIGQKLTIFSSNNAQASINIGTADTYSQTWLWPNITYRDTSVVTGVNPSATPFAFDFPNATHSQKSSITYYDEATKMDVNYESYRFFRLSDTSLVNLGSGLYFPGTDVVKNIEHNKSISLKFPMKYGDQYIISQDTSSLSENQYQVETVTKTIDAFGSITFPEGMDSYYALRVKTEDKTNVYKNDSLLNTNAKRIYDWYTRSNGIAEFNADTSSLTSGIVTAYNLSLTLFGEKLTTVKNKTTSFLNTFSLSQNYPNPFNPSTIISYSLPKDSFVTLKVYSVLGNEVATLVNEKKIAGNYESIFDPANISSGVYYYKLTAGNFSKVKKMLFLK